MKASVFGLGLMLTLTANLSPPAHAQVTRDNKASTTLITAINSANTSVKIFSPWLKSQPVAQSLINAINKRGVKVTILTTSLTITEPSSYFLGLKLAGADLRTMIINNYDTAQPFLLIDDRRLYYTTVTLSNDTINTATKPITDPSIVKKHREWFTTSTAAALAIARRTTAYLLTLSRVEETNKAIRSLP